MVAHSRSIAASPEPGAVRYTIATLVTERAQYADMIASFEAKGFADADCEYLCIDNSAANTLDAYRGLNRLLDEARGDLVILCHQDIALIDDGRPELEARLAELDRLDPAWAVAGNAGGMGLGRFAIRITDGHFSNLTMGTLPARVASLDENFLVVKRSARLSLSADLEGFHFYGTDLCLVADMLGHSAYVVDFHLHHFSRGTLSPAFYACQQRLRQKYARAFRSRWVQTTCSHVYISGASWGQGMLGGLRLLAAKLPQKARRWFETLRRLRPASSRLV